MANHATNGSTSATGSSGTTGAMGSTHATAGNFQSTAHSGSGGYNDQALTTQNQGGVKREFDNFVADIRSLFDSATSTGNASLDDLKAKVAERTETAKRAINSASATVTEKVKQGTAVAEDYVHREPWKALGLAAAVGTVIGMLIASGRK